VPALVCDSYDGTPFDAFITTLGPADLPSTAIVDVVGESCWCCTMPLLDGVIVKPSSLSLLATAVADIVGLRL